MSVQIHGSSVKLRASRSMIDASPCLPHASHFFLIVYIQDVSCLALESSNPGPRTQEVYAVDYRLYLDLVIVRDERCTRIPIDEVRSRSPMDRFAPRARTHQTHIHLRVRVLRWVTRISFVAPPSRIYSYLDNSTSGVLVFVSWRVGIRWGVRVHRSTHAYEYRVRVYDLIQESWRLHT